MSDPILGNELKLTEPPSVEPTKKAPTKGDITALLAGFEPAAAVQPTPAEKERNKRLDQANAQVRRFAVDLQNLGVADAKDLAAAERALKALGTVAKAAAAAIASIPDGKLGVADSAPAKPRKPRESKTTTLTPEEAQAAVERESTAGPDEDETLGEELEIAKVDPTEGETGEETAARIKADREARGATSAAPSHSGPPRSGPSSQGDPRGDVDPNAGDGF